MKKKNSTGEPLTTAENLERRFDKGKNALDYFDAAGAIHRINYGRKTGTKPGKPSRRKCDI